MMFKRFGACFVALLLSGYLEASTGCRELLNQKISEIYLSPFVPNKVLHRFEDLMLDFDRSAVFNVDYAKKKLVQEKAHETEGVPEQLQFNFAKDPRVILENSELQESYATILRILVNPAKKAWAEKIFASLERYDQSVGIENYGSWIKFLSTNRPIELNYRLYEGAYALSVLRSMNVKVAFEPARGFFSRLDDKYASKSMDLRLSDPETGKVLAYREVKRVGSSYNVVTGLKSAFRKADFALTRLTERVELNVVLFIEGEIPEYFVNEGMHEGDFYPQAIHRIAYEFSLRAKPSLDSVLIINLKLKKYAKIYHLQDGKTQIEQGDFG